MISANPHSHAAELALSVYGTVLERVRGDRLVRQSVQRAGSELFVQDHRIDLASFQRVFVAGVGKASVSMAKGLIEILGDRCSGGLIVTKEGHAEGIGALEVIEAGHPLPTSESVAAGDRMLEFARSCTEFDLVLFVLSGGASALLENLAEGVTLEDLIQTTGRLLASGADIRTINAVRSRLSRTKAGGLAQAFAPATVVVLALSDVVGNDLPSIGSGPFVAPRETSIPAEILLDLPEVVQAQFRYPLLHRPAIHVPHYVIGSVSLAVHEAAAAARKLGLEPLPYQDPLRGEARIMARRIVRETGLQVTRHPGRFCMIFGGETTVKLRGSGLGGRCQEMAAAASWQLSRLSDTAFLAAGTDGSDGPTLAAGGLVDSNSCRRAKMPIREALRQNDSYRYLESCDGLVFTGPTGSNVNDLVLVVHAAS